MPIEKKYPIDQLIRSLQGFARRVTFEYVLIKGANDALADADALAKIAAPLGAHVNLLPLHPGGAPGCEPTSTAQTEAFARRLEERRVKVTVRRSRGPDIDAACGQLWTKTLSKEKPPR